MSFFDPPKMKEKPRIRPRLSFPEGMNRKLFYIIYFGSILFWPLLFMAVGAAMLFGIFPLFGLRIQAPWLILILVTLFIAGSYIGMMMASIVVNAIINYGVSAGDIKVVKPGSSTHNADV